MAWGQDFLKGFIGNDYLRDYRHASKTFTTNGYELAPRYKFLYHVTFNLNFVNPAVASVFSTQDQANMGLVVKTAQLPSYTMAVAEMNQYNRKRYVQTKIDYQPVVITFHDDGGDLIRNLWYNYYSYYYKDPQQNYRNLTAISGSIGDPNTSGNGYDYNNSDIYASSRIVNDWGYIGESYTDGSGPSNSVNPTSGKPKFFNDIIVTGFNQHRYAMYVLINPIITSWSHDTYDYAQSGGIMQNSMTIKYETVKYLEGAIGDVRRGGDTNVLGFADNAHYDTTLSPIARPGANATVLGQGGLLDAGIGIIGDLQAVASGRGGLQNILGAVQTAGRTYNTFKGKNLKAIANEEARSAATQVLQQDLPSATRAVINKGNGVFFPNAPRVGPGPFNNFKP
jgi:hypothetical protein